jgi:hypothetical protein
MKKSKSFKSLSDLKDIDLFRSDDKAITSNQKKESQISKVLVTSKPLSIYPSDNKTSTFQKPILGSIEQEDSYQQRLKWIARREEEVSVDESALIISKGD